MRELLRGLLDLALPRVCARCGAAACDRTPLCARCFAALPRVAARSCARCQQAPGSAPGQLCSGCVARPSPLAACIAGAWFLGEVERWIRRFKYPARGLSRLDPSAPAVARALVREAARRAPDPPVDRVMPIPLHPRALRRRGFNPALLLAREAAHSAGAPVAPVALQRVRDTLSQTGLDRAGRRRNVRGAFRVRQPQTGRIWLVDDVVTTGATPAAGGGGGSDRGVRRPHAVTVRLSV
jgi:predicted amidophosphoribosyltransferase